ncbi:type 4a pilus biogenesis protein PilO [Motilibacter aurantiacus]|uniref:type 4a pilus biogenesis protein PilO n=1 Tax=Motilibacter aurantiacus TaxID=2714955 RepID=UPI001407D45B|nr:type 4a pilus biogenesis protein PilO [Motilibacter aurantiacus]NHC46010.1 type 4a pilus biogenesis protein PilO [Motilibacter aurantiacus]
MTRTQKWTAATVAAGLVLLAAGWLLLLGPKRAEASGLRDEATAQLAQNAQLSTQLGQLKVLAQELPAKQRALAQLNSKVPDSVDLPTLVRRITALATASGVTLGSISPAAPVALAGTDGTVTGMQSVSVGLTVTGDYFEVAGLLSRLETMGRAFLVTTVSLTDAMATGTDEAPAGTVQAQIQGAVFVRPADGTGTAAGGTAAVGSSAPAATLSGTTPSGTTPSGTPAGGTSTLPAS